MILSYCRACSFGHIDIVKVYLKVLYDIKYNLVARGKKLQIKYSIM